MSDAPSFPGMWMNLQGNLLYRIVPKCACSTVGQFLYYTDHGQFFDGDIHDAKEGMHKWAFEDSRAPIRAAVAAGARLFSVVRNPYARVLSAYTDKIVGTQRGGGQHAPKILTLLTERYGFMPDRPGREPKNFHAFLKMVEDAHLNGVKEARDIHWAPAVNHLATAIRNGGSFSMIGQTEKLAEALQEAFDGTKAAPLAHQELPRFNPSSVKLDVPMEKLFQGERGAIVRKVYRKDFKFLGYDPQDPTNRQPIAPVDLEELAHQMRRRGDNA